MKRGFMALLCGLLACAALLAGCAGREARETEPAPGAGSGEAASEEPAERGEPAEPSDGPAEALLAEIGAVRDVIRPIAAQVESPNGYAEPTGGQYRGMVDAAAALGVPVVYEGFDMENEELAVSFCEAAEAGRDGTLTIYRLIGSMLNAETFRSEGGAVTLTSSYWEYGMGTDAPITSEPARALDQFELQPGGHLVYRLEEYPDAQMGFRVLPLGEENRALARKYVLPVCHTRFGVTSADWDETDLSPIHWEWTFEGLLTARTGRTIMDAYPEPYTPGTEYPYAVPAEEVDGTLTAHFPVTAEQLHLLSAYDPQRQVYAWQGFWGGTDFRVPEVVSKTDNPDGSFTLAVDFVGMGFYETGERCELTVRDRADGGWEYLSNRHHPAPEE